MKLVLGIRYTYCCIRIHTYHIKMISLYVSRLIVYLIKLINNKMKNQKIFLIKSIEGNYRIITAT